MRITKGQIVTTANGQEYTVVSTSADGSVLTAIRLGLGGGPTSERRYSVLMARDVTAV